MKTITWITPEYFIETDIHIVSRLCEYFKINWYIVYVGSDNLYDKELKILQKKIPEKKLNINKTILPKKNPLATDYLLRYCKLLNDVRKTNADLYYSAIIGMPYYIPIAMIKLPKSKTIFAAHNVTTPKGAAYANITSAYNDLCYKYFDNFQTFSQSQKRKLLEKCPTKNIFYAPFILKDYGTPTASPNEIITFISFGRIRGYKCIENIIDAAQKVAVTTKIPFKVIIAGECSNWQAYSSKIQNPEIFELIIREIENDEIPNLFGRSHYSLYPYKDIAQSGALYVSLNYKVPPILSDLPAFKEIVNDREDSLFVTPDNKEELYEKMLYAVENFTTLYPVLKAGIEKTVMKNYTSEKIVHRYLQFFNSLINT